MASQSYQPARKARNTWMAGKIKCGNCGYALMSAHSCGYLYLRCTKHAENKSCPGCGTIKMRAFSISFQMERADNRIFNLRAIGPASMRLAL